MAFARLLVMQLYAEADMDLNLLIQQLYAEDLEQVMRMTGSQKLRAGGDLFDEACRWTLAGIRAQYPGISKEEALAELRRRVDETESLRV